MTLFSLPTLSHPTATKELTVPLLTNLHPSTGHPPLRTLHWAPSTGHPPQCLGLALTSLCLCTLDTCHMFYT